MLSVEGLETRYGQIQALKGISLEVREGEIVALIGANGAGKTTLLMSLIGVLAPNAGSIAFLGERIDRRSPPERVRQGLVLVPEGRRILMKMTVYENLLMGAYLRRDRAQIAADIEDVFRRFPRLRERRENQASVLSGGEQQMLAIGRALMAKPKLLMLDEPSLGLAPLVVNEVFDIIRELHQSGLTVLLVEQNARKALQIADRAYVLETGRVVAAGASATLLSSPEVQAAYLGGSEAGGAGVRR